MLSSTRLVSLVRCGTKESSHASEAEPYLKVRLWSAGGQFPPLTGAVSHVFVRLRYVKCENL